MTPTLQILGRLEGKIDEYKDLLTKLNNAIYGNGQVGVIERLTRMEETVEKLVGATEINTKNIGELTKSFEAHINTNSKHSLKDMILNKETLTIIILSFVALHSFLPENLTVWSLVSKLLGY